MRLYIPTCGDTLRLTSDWTFVLYDESRNYSLHEKLNVAMVKHPHRYALVPGTFYDGYPEEINVTLPTGTVLKVDRVYIRAFNRGAQSLDEDFDSITFAVTEHPTWKHGKGKKQHARFWVKLRDANTLDFEHAAPPRWAV
jgi:hypothetical protein